MTLPEVQAKARKILVASAVLVAAKTVAEAYAAMDTLTTAAEVVGDMFERFELEELGYTKDEMDQYHRKRKPDEEVIKAGEDLLYHFCSKRDANGKLFILPQLDNLRCDTCGMFLTTAGQCPDTGSENVQWPEDAQ